MSRVVIVGGGVSGGLIAGGLAARGFKVSCHERAGPEDHATAGNGLNVGPNALLTLAQALPDVLRELEARSLPWTQWLARYADGNVAWHLPLAEVSPRAGIRIRWSDVYAVARQCGGPNVHYRQRLHDIRIEPSSQQVRVRFRNLDTEEITTTTADWVIAADGRYSAVREALAGKPIPRHLGVANFRCLLEPGSVVGIDDMEQWYQGPHRIIAFRLADERIYVSGNLPIVPGTEVPAHFSNASFLYKSYHGDGQLDPRFAALIEAFSAVPQAYHWARAQEISVRFSDLGDRVLYVGDARHGMVPTLGQGATQAIEDAATLLRMIDHLQATAPTRISPTSLTAAYSRLRAARVDFVRRLSWEASDSLLLGADPRATLTAKRSERFCQQLRRLYDEVPGPEELTLP